MAICSRCGKSFDPENEAEEFLEETGLDYNNLTETLCFDCANEAVNDMEDGIYFEICEECGTKYDPFKAAVDFEIRRPDWCCDGINEWSDGKLLCCDCAMAKWQDGQDRDYDEFEEDN